MSERDLNDDSTKNLIRLCARGYSRALQIRLAAHNIGYGQWMFLRILWRADGLTQRQLSELAALTEPTTHTALLRMEKDDLVERRHKPNNRRKQYVYLTRKGRELQDVLAPLAEAVNELAVSGLSERDTEHLRNMLSTIIGNLDEDELQQGEHGRRVPPTRTNLTN